MRSIVFLLLAGALTVGCKRQPRFDTSDLTSALGYTYSDAVTGIIVKSTEAHEIGEHVTFVGLSSHSPRVVWSGTGSTSQMKNIYESDTRIVIQQTTLSGSLDTITIEKKTGFFVRTSSYQVGKLSAGAAVGVCK